jgi:hypothetical protein
VNTQLQNKKVTMKCMQELSSITYHRLTVMRKRFIKEVIRMIFILSQSLLLKVHTITVKVTKRKLRRRSLKSKSIKGTTVKVNLSKSMHLKKRSKQLPKLHLRYKWSGSHLGNHHLNLESNPLRLWLNLQCRCHYSKLQQ